MFDDKDAPVSDNETHQIPLGTGFSLGTTQVPLFLINEQMADMQVWEMQKSNVQTANDCAGKCDAGGAMCIGFNFKPNVQVVKGGKWRNAKQGLPNCKLLTLTWETKGVLLSKIVASSGKPKNF